MEARELIDFILPDHCRTSCSDKNIANGFGTMGIIHKGTLAANGRCLRCMLLEIEQDMCYDGTPIPKDAANHIREDW